MPFLRATGTAAGALIIYTKKERIGMNLIYVLVNYFYFYRFQLV